MPPLGRLLLIGLSSGLAATLGCSSGSGSGGSSNSNTVSCLATLSGMSPQCQFYEASGKDAAAAINQLRAGCVNQAGMTAKVVASCPTAGNLGGCKTSVPVAGGAQVTLTVTDFEYASAADAGVLGQPQTAQQVQQEYSMQGDPYVAAP